MILSCATQRSCPGDWFRVFEIAEQIFAIDENGHVTSFLINGDKRSLLVDSGMGLRPIRPVVEMFSVGTPVLLNTHWHFDHIGGNTEFPERGISSREAQLVGCDVPSEAVFAGHFASAMAEGLPLPPGTDPHHVSIRGCPSTFLISDGEEFDLGGRVVRALSAGGHTRGSFIFLVEDAEMVLGGDLFTRMTWNFFADSDAKETVLATHGLLENSSWKHVAPAHQFTFRDPADPFSICARKNDLELLERSDIEAFSVAAERAAAGAPANRKLDLGFAKPSVFIERTKGSEASQDGRWMLLYTEGGGKPLQYPFLPPNILSV
jgi:glyoxylase-like metal-dependent hydrolase (beta-lactamase superfamily II)